jgi:hypothetical protein
VEAYTAQYEAVDSALRVLEWSPQASHVLNARDYYLQGDFAYAKAREEHQARLASLRKVRDELYGILEHLLDG